MELSALVNDLKLQSGSSDLSREQEEKLLDGRIILPNDARGSEVKFQRHNYGDRGSDPLYQLLGSMLLGRSIDQVEPIVNELFNRAKELQLPHGVANAQYDLFWSAQDFQEEKKLPDFVTSEITIRGGTYAVDPTKVRIGFPGQRHDIKAEMATNKLSLSAQGSYRGELEHFARELNPQFANLRLSKDDAQRLLKSVESNSRAKRFVPSLREALKPQEYVSISFGLGGHSVGSRDIIKITVATKELDLLRQAIGKPLLNGPQKEETRVEELIKTYGPIDLLRGRRLHDLQYLARSIPQIDLGIVYGSPVVTLDQARELLEKEIEIMTKGYGSTFGLGLNSHLWMGGVVKSLATEHFDKAIVDRFDELRISDYVDLLKSQGYIPEKDVNQNEPQTGREIIAKEMHLFDFFKQSYSKDPRASVEKYRARYTNHKPDLEIYASGDIDSLELRAIILPPRSRLTSFGIKQPLGSLHNNALKISRLLPSSEEVHFFSTTSVGNPIFLGLQEYAYREMGVRFT